MSKRKSSDDRKAEILAITLDLAFEVGPGHVTTGMIAGRLGLTQPAIYRHFPKKEDIWRAVGETLRARIIQNSQTSQNAGQNPMDRLRGLLLSHLHLVSETPALPELMVTRDPSATLTDARRLIQAAMGEFRGAMTREVEAARAAGHLRANLAVDDGVMLLLGIIQSLVLKLIVTRNPAPLVQDGERLLDLQLSLFANQGDAL